METIVKFSDKNSNYTKFEFFQKYRNCKNDMNNEITKSIQNVFKFEIFIHMLTIYTQKCELNIYQKYILCELLHTLNKNKIIQNSPEMRDRYIGFLIYCINYIQADDRGIWDFDNTELYVIENNDGNNCKKCFNLIRKIYKVLYETFIVETDFNYCRIILEEMINFFTLESFETKKFIFIYTFISNNFIIKLIKLYNLHSYNIEWEYLGMIITKFIYICLQYNLIIDTPLLFSSNFLDLLMLLLKDDNEYSNLVISTFVIVISNCVHDNNSADYLNVGLLDQILKKIANENDINFKLDFLFNFNQILFIMFDKKIILAEQYYNKILTFFIEIYNSTLDDFNKKSVSEQIMVYIYIIYSYINCTLNPLLIQFLEKLIVGTTDYLIYLLVLNVILNHSVIKSQLIFKYMCVYYQLFIVEPEMVALYVSAMYKFMKYSHQYDLEYKYIAKEYPQCLELNDMHYIKYNLVYTSLFEKCQLYIIDNYNNLTFQELIEIKHLM